MSHRGPAPVCRSSGNFAACRAFQRRPGAEGQTLSTRMLLAQWPVSVVMQRQTSGLRWRQVRWSARAVLPGGFDHAEALPARMEPGCLQLLVPGLMLELYSDEIDGYFENWLAPAPKVFVAWQMQAGHDGERAMPVLVSVNGAEGARMRAAGDGADGVDMPPPVHAWLGACLAQHRPRRAHRGHVGRAGGPRRPPR